MTPSKIQKMKFFMFLLIFLLAQTPICYGNFRERRDADESAAAAVDKVEAAGETKIDKPFATSVRKNGQQDEIGLSVDARKLTDGNRTHDDITSKSSDAATPNKTAHITNTSYESGEDHTTFNTGAIVRGFLVFTALSILVMAYIVFRSLRLSKTRAQMVRKYGVLTHRQDVEMRPLPLEEEDDEDTTVFDASNVLTNSVQHQNA